MRYYIVACLQKPKLAGIVHSDALREKCPYSELFWFVFFRIRAEYGEILRISPYSVRMLEKPGQNNFKYGHFLHSDNGLKIYIVRFGQHLSPSYFNGILIQSSKIVHELNPKKYLALADGKNIIKISSGSF